MEYFNQDKSQQDIIVHLINTNIRLQAEFLALNNLFEKICSQVDSNFDRTKVAPLREKLVDDYMKQIVATHPLYSNVWKEELKRNLGDIPGLHLED